MTSTNKHTNLLAKFELGFISSIDDILALVRKHDGSNYVFRGEDDTRYPLRAKMGRHRIEPETKDYFGTEKQVLHDFKRRATPYVTHRPGSELEWLALAQHHGLATRLLDWSENILVALYFAVRNYSRASERVLYSLQVDDFEYLEPDEDPFVIKKIYLYEPNHLTPRISSQAGIFTVHPSPNTPFKSRRLRRWVIRDSAVISLGLSLDLLGVNAATMFPGLDGIAEHINNYGPVPLEDAA